MKLHDIVDPSVSMILAALVVCTVGVLVALGWWSLSGTAAASEDEGGMASESTSSSGPTEHCPARTVTQDRVREPSAQEARRS